MDKETFEKIENAYRCGYWNVCDDHACGCSPDSEVAQVYKSMRK